MDIMFRALEQKNDERHRDVMAAIGRVEIQTTEHNGRMGKLEGWRTGITYATLAVWAVLIVIIIPLGIFAFNVATRCAGDSCQKSNQGIGTALNP